MENETENEIIKTKEPVLSSDYDRAYPGLEFQWERLCRQMNATFGVKVEDFPDFETALTEFSKFSLPVFSSNLLLTLQKRKEWWNSSGSFSALLRYGRYLGRELDEFSDQEALHQVELRFNAEWVEVRVSIYLPANPPARKICVTKAEKLQAKRVDLTLESPQTLFFCRPNNQFLFSPAMAVADSNEVIGFVLSHSTLTAEDIWRDLSGENS